MLLVGANHPRHSCQDCGYHYIGETGLRLSTMVKQHKDAVRKGETEKSAIAEHVWTTQHTINWDNISVVDQDKDSIPRKIREASDDMEAD